jgi:membrane associated rhomboid family serine protease|eukprot:g2949.t1
MASTAPTAAEYVKSINSGTLFFLGTCCILQIGQYMLGLKLEKYMMSPLAVYSNHEFYRIVSGSFFHAGLMHIGFNMMSLLTLGEAVERILGTFRFVFYTFVTVMLSNFLYLAVCIALGTFYERSWWYYNSVGFSGVLFAYATIESFLSPFPTRNFFGCTVPSKWYPWILLGGLQILMPNISFLGHLAGLVLGVCYVYGLLEWTIPSNEYIKTLEGKHRNFALLQSTRYVNAPETMHTMLEPHPCCRGTCSGVSRIGSLFSSTVATVQDRTARASASVIRRARERQQQRYEQVSTIDEVDEEGDEEFGVDDGANP